MTTILDEKALEKARNAIVNVWDDARGIDPNLYTMAETAIRAYLAALATPSTGAVGEPVAWRYRSGFRKGVWLLTSNDTLAYAETAQGNEVEPLYAAPPSSPSERDAARTRLEHSPGEKVALMRLAYHVIEGDETSGFDKHQARMILHLLARYEHALKASRSDTVGPEAGTLDPNRERGSDWNGDVDPRSGAED
jgi:hypothetical protein